MKKLSIVIPSIGREKYIDQTLKSVLKQTTPADEIIVFDNSTTQDIKIKSMFGDNSLIRWEQSTKHLGPIDSWNSSVKLAQHEYISIIGDDDLLKENYVQNAKNIIANYDFGILKADVINENNEFKRHLQYPQKKIINYEELRTCRIKRKVSLFVPGLVFKKSLFLQVGMFEDTKVDGLTFSDELLCYKLAALLDQVAFSEHICWLYRVHSDQIGNKDCKKQTIEDAIRYVDQSEHSLLNVITSKKNIYNKNVNRQKYIDYVYYFIALQNTKHHFHKNRENYFLKLKFFLFNYFFCPQVSFKGKILVFLQYLSKVCKKA